MERPHGGEDGRDPRRGARRVRGCRRSQPPRLCGAAAGAQCRAARRICAHAAASRRAASCRGMCRSRTRRPMLPKPYRGADLIMLVVPSVAHEPYARALAPLLDGSQPIFLNPGHTGGGLHFLHELRKAGYHGADQDLRDRVAHLRHPHGRSRDRRHLQLYQAARLRRTAGQAYRRDVRPGEAALSRTSARRRA